MRAVVLTSYGDPDVLTAMEVPDPLVGPSDVLVDVVATALNRADLLQRRGLYPEPGAPREHEIPGMELAGRVAAIGSQVTEWSIGDEVMAIVSGGAYAERVAVPERQLMRVPAGIAVADAAAIPEVGITAHDALVVQGGLRSGGWALIHAGGSGVGSMGIQIVKAMGARVVTTASARKVAAVQALGADVVVDRGSDDFVAAVRVATDGAGVDVVLDVVGGDYLPRNIKSLRTSGTIVQVGVMGGGEAMVNLGALLARRAHLVGTVLRARPLEQKIDATRRFAAEVIPAIEAGTVRPVIDSRYPLGAIADAHRYLETNANVGKVIIDV